VSGTTVSAGKITADAGIDIDNINIDGTTIALSSGDLTLDVAGDIILDADTGVWRFKDAGTTLYQIAVDGASVVLYTGVSDADMVFKGNDGGSTVTALTLDMSEAGAATFNSTLATTELNVSQSANSTRSYKLLQGYGYTTGGNYYGQYAIGTTYNSAANTGTLEFFTGSGSSAPTNRLTIYSSGDTVFNESGVDADFRVESDTNTHALFVQGSDGNVGIGVSAPTYKLNLLAAAGAQNIFQAGQSAVSNGLSITSDGSALTYSFLTGNVGIGTATPAGTLHVDKDIASGANYGIIQNDGTANTNTIAGWVIRDGTTIMSGIRRRRDGGTSPTEIGNFSSDEAVFFLQNNESCLQLNGDGSIVFNEDALDKDFRVESDTESNAFTVDGETGQVGVGSRSGFRFGNGSLQGNAGSSGGGYPTIGYNIKFTGTQEDYGTLVTDTSWRLDIGENNRLQVFSRSSTTPVASGASFTAGPYVSINGTDWTSSSDARLKENVNTITGAIDKVKAMNPVNYTWIHDGEGASNQVGFIAQEMALVVPEVVDIPEDDEVHQGIQYGKLVPVLTAALQEAITKIETLEARITALES
jgi:hypothetical protein